MTEKEIYNGKWLTFKTRTVNGKEWEYVSRNKQQEAVIIRAKKANNWVFVIQHRYPINKKVLEFPAGLIDNNETPSEAALRELREETGYIGEVVQVSPPLVSSAGISDEVIYYVDVKIIDETEQDLDEHEMISVQEVHEDAVISYLKQTKLFVDNKIWNYFIRL